MRIDKQLNKQGCTPRQVFFIECWGNLSHKNSIDTDRVSFNNPLNASNELLFLYQFGDKYKGIDKRARAAEELLELLKKDVVAAQPIFEDIPQTLISLLETKELLRDSGRSPVEKKQKLIQSMVNQLVDSFETYYIEKAIELIEIELNLTSEPSDPDYEKIANLSNGLMSVVLTLGMPISECYLLYKRILLGKNGELFSSRFSSWRSKLCNQPTEYDVKITIESNKLHDMFQSTQQSVTFNGCIYQPVITEKNKKAVEININTIARSVLSARVNAEAILEESLDVVAYMIGRNDINTHSSFTVKDSSGLITNIAKFENEINANTDRLTLNEFSFFMNSMGKIYTQSPSKSLKKISSAFHFLRNGISKSSKESRYTSYWSALESLTLGVSSNDLTHDEHVIYSVVPCIGVDYIVKQMALMRDIILSESMIVTDSAGSAIDFNHASLADLYTYFKDGSISSQIESGLVNHPYSAYMFRKLLLLCNNHREMGSKIIKHAEKVTLQIHRLYILRNSIVHNAESSPYIEMLTANLEHYLRGTINAMFYMASTLPRVSSSEEAFIRYHHMFEKMIVDLEPTHGAKHNKIDGINKQIGEGQIVTSDAVLVKWLKLHS